MKIFKIGLNTWDLQTPSPQLHETQRDMEIFGLQVQNLWHQAKPIIWMYSWISCGKIEKCKPWETKWMITSFLFWTAGAVLFPLNKIFPNTYHSSSSILNYRQQSYLEILKRCWGAASCFRPLSSLTGPLQFKDFTGSPKYSDAVLYFSAVSCWTVSLHKYIASVCYIFGYTK